MPCLKRWRKPRRTPSCILTADNAEQLLPTIASRCEILRLRPLPVETGGSVSEGARC